MSNPAKDEATWLKHAHLLCLSEFPASLAECSLAVLHILLTGCQVLFHLCLLSFHIPVAQVVR